MHDATEKKIFRNNGLKSKGHADEAVSLRSKSALNRGAFTASIAEKG